MRCSARTRSSSTRTTCPAGSRWRDVIARTLHASPILLVLVTPNYLGARDGAGKRCIERADDPVRDELDAGLAAKRPRSFRCSATASPQTPAAADLPPPFDQLAELHLAAPARLRLARGPGAPRRRPARLGIVPRTTPGALGSGPLPARRVPKRATVRHAASRAGGSRSPRGALVLVGAGVAAWRWQDEKAASLAGRWRASDRQARRDHRTRRRDRHRHVTQTGESVRVASSAVDIEQRPRLAELPRVLAGAHRPAADPGLLSRRRRPAARRRRRRAARRPVRSRIAALGARRLARRRRADRHRRAARHGRARRPAHPRAACG